jgi:hypothetical protein
MNSKYEFDYEIHMVRRYRTREAVLCLTKCPLPVSGGPLRGVVTLPEDAKAMPSEMQRRS